MALTSRTNGTVRTYLGECEAWKIHHEEANACFDFEDLLALGNSAFNAIDRWDIVWHQKVNSDPSLFDIKDEKAILGLYKLWLVPASSLLEGISQFEDRDYQVVGARDFRVHVEEARGLLMSDDEFFGAELLPLQEEALRAHRDGETVAIEEIGD